MKVFLNSIGTTQFVFRATGIKDVGLKRHFCSYCPYSTFVSAHLKRHILTHTGERPFACTVCNYRCNQKENLKKHMIRHAT